MIALLIILIFAVALSTTVMVLCLDIIADRIVDAIKAADEPTDLDCGSFTGALKQPLRPGARDGTTLEDLVRARQHFEQGTPHPLPPLADIPTLTAAQDKDV